MKKLVVSMTVLLILMLPNAQADTLSAIKNCLSNWSQHPFNVENPKYRVIHSRVKVFGIGGDIHETNQTKEPELVLIEPNVSVMTKARMNLLNHNGWYCLQSKVSIMAKSIINIDCKAHLTSSEPGATILGSNQGEDGVTVLGKAVVNKVNCH